MSTSMLRYLLSFVFVAIVYCSNEKLDEKTTEAVGKAVIDAEQKGGLEQNKEAEAVAKATIGVLKSESEVGYMMPKDVIQDASNAAKATYKELRHATVDSKVAADAAAKVAIAEVNGAAPYDVNKVATENAEKAAVAVGSALADRPRSEAEAISNAVTKVKEEEKTPGPVDVTDKSVISKAEDAVSNLPVAAEREVKSMPKVIFLLFLIPLGYIVYKHKGESQPSEYMQKILQIRKEINIEEGREMFIPETNEYKAFEA